ncbi:MAG: PAS domain S-box protein [Burkholderiales bacterium]
MTSTGNDDGITIEPGSAHEARHLTTLLKADALQSAIFNSANFSLIAADDRGVIQIFNVGAERMLGYAADDVLNRITPADISDPHEIIVRAQALSAEFGMTIAPGFEALVFKASRGIEDMYELTYLCKDGSRLPAVVSVTALRGIDDAIIGYLLIGTDNTARKLVEADRERLDQRLRDQQFYTRSLIESIVDALVTTDPAGIISDVNEETEALTGRTRDELIGTPFRGYFTEPLRAQECIERVLSEKKVVNYELTAVSARGRAVVSLNATPFYDRDRLLKGVIIAARDVTERARLDEALRLAHSELQAAKDEAERANRAKSDFLSGMSHELRSPLNAILGFAQLMDSGRPKPTPEQKDSVDQILQAGWYLLELINEVLDLSLIESGKLSLSPEPMALDEVLADCQAMIEPQARKSGIRVDFLRPRVPLFIRADRTRVKQIIVNLLSNAIKYNRVGGNVEVSCRAVAAGRVRMSFEDTGEGLAPTELAQLFQPFNRLGQQAGVEEGTGIGLVVSKQLVELMGGTIGARSTVGVGSVFWIELNGVDAAEMSPAANLTAPILSSDTTPGAPMRTVLCVEDNPANMMLVARLLERRPDISLISAKDGRSGVELAQSARPDVILMDINLPGIGGLTALSILAGDATTAQIPVIAVSANAMPRDIERGLEAGFFRYLTKPIRVDEFLETLDLALEAAAGRADLSHDLETSP